MNKPKSIAFLKLRPRNTDGYLDQLYALQAITNISMVPILTRRERLNYDANCRYHHCTNVFRPLPSGKGFRPFTIYTAK